jgi:hypothetical protein
MASSKVNSWGIILFVASGDVPNCAEAENAKIVASNATFNCFIVYLFI